MSNEKSNSMLYLSLTFLAVVQPTLANDADLEFDRLTLADGTTMQVVLADENRPVALGTGQQIRIRRQDGREDVIDSRSIVGIVYREQFKLEELVRLCEDAAYVEAEPLIVDLRFAMQGWPERDDSIDWSIFHAHAWPAEMVLARRAVQENRIDEAVQRLDEIREINGPTKSIRGQAQEMLEAIFSEFGRKAVERADWPAAETAAQELLRRYPHSTAMRDVLGAINSEIRGVMTKVQQAFTDDRVSEGEDLLRSVLRIRPRDAGARRKLVEIQRRKPSLSCALIGTLQGWHPQARHSYASRAVGHLCFRSLFSAVRTNEEGLDSEFVPDLVESYRISPCGDEIQIQLRPNLRWSDGVRLTTNDVYYTMKEMSQPGNPHGDPRLAIWFDLNEPPATTERIVLRCRVPVPSILRHLCFPVLPRHRPFQKLESVGEDEYVVSGPFVPHQIDAERLELRPNEQFGNAAPGIHRLIIQCFGDLDDAIDSFRAGRAQLICGLEGCEAEYFIGQTRIGEIVSTEAFAFHFLAFSGEWLSRWSKEEAQSVRESIAKSLDRDTAAADCFGTPALGLLPEGSWAHSTDARVSVAGLDSTAAKDLLAKLSGSDKLSPRFLYPNRRATAQAAKQLANSLTSVGIVVRESPVPWSEYIAQTHGQRDFDIVYGVEPYSSDEFDFAPLFFIDHPRNFMGIRDANLMKTINANWTTVNRERVLELSRRMEQIVLQEYYVVPLWHTRVSSVRSSRLIGMKPNSKYAFEDVESWQLVPDRD